MEMLFLIIGMEIAVFWMALVFCLLLAYLHKIKEFYLLTLGILFFFIGALISEIWMMGIVDIGGYIEIIIDGKTMIFYKMICYLIAGLFWIPAGILLIKRSL